VSIHSGILYILFLDKFNTVRFLKLFNYYGNAVKFVFSKFIYFRLDKFSIHFGKLYILLFDKFNSPKFLSVVSYYSRAFKLFLEISNFNKFGKLIIIYDKDFIEISFEDKYKADSF
jgi:hypothetical protein